MSKEYWKYKIATCSHLKGDEFINTFYETYNQPKPIGGVSYQVDEMKDIDSYDCVGNELKCGVQVPYSEINLNPKKFMNYYHKHYYY